MWLPTALKVTLVIPSLTLSLIAAGDQGTSTGSTRWHHSGPGDEQRQAAAGRAAVQRHLQ